MIQMTQNDTKWYKMTQKNDTDDTKWHTRMIQMTQSSTQDKNDIQRSHKITKRVIIYLI